MNRVDRALGWLLVMTIHVYRWTLGPLLGGQCYAPSCSVYAIDAVRRHGAVRGGKLAAGRLLRCHPLGDSGYDPVP